MKKTILITGTSSGIGRAAVKLFSERGWNVAATMRSPEKENELNKLPGVKLFKLDVMDSASIADTVNLVLKEFKSLDVVVNNAGYAAVGAFEAATKSQIQKQFDTNVFGVMNVIREVLPHFREKRGGTIVNVTSMGGRLTFPIYSLYHGTKWAVEGFTESLHFELRPLNIRVKNVAPGPIKTEFYDASMDIFHKEGLTAYENYQATVMKNSNEFGQNAPGPEVVAKAIWRAANSTSWKLRYTSDFLGRLTLLTRNWVPLSWYFGMIRMMTEKGFKAGKL